MYTREQIKAAVEKKGYKWFNDDANKSYDVNIVGIRNSEKSDVPVSEPFKLEVCDERAPGGPSGTKVREAIKADDRKLFEKLTPKSVHPFYDDLKKYL